MSNCPCGSTRTYQDCCGPVIAGQRRAETAQELMRSRYSAYVMKEIPWLRASLHPANRADFNEATTRSWAERAEWQGIAIVNTVAGGPSDTKGQVEFIVKFMENGVAQEHRERSNFEKIDGAWYFTEGKPMGAPPVKREGPKAGRNDPCPCGSGKKFKKCCGA
ncbi:MAG: YchJ family protein [Nitrospirota bacterium]|nr:YchJ family protein [Nitrospirota bacterium]